MGMKASIGEEWAFKAWEEATKKGGVLEGKQVT